MGAVKNWFWLNCVLQQPILDNEEILIEQLNNQ